MCIRDRYQRRVHGENCEISARDSIITVRSTSEYLTTSLASNATKIENCILKVNNEGLSTEEIAKTVGINFNGTGDAYLNNNEFVGISKTVITNGYWVLRNKYQKIILIRMRTYIEGRKDIHSDRTKQNSKKPGKNQQK
eukprot:TRINITY_DN35619_c0_g1_i1.p1 TRINITY_DN35619_c0_g1~~TRINITY_DN35619_c0_g1_i1.p1  ORF type:complete len:139 (+),score=5.67 TRINITY_DN35619_c0_g1_i1:93-509(+)